MSVRLRAYDELLAASGGDEIEYWYPIQNLLVSAGTISFILWPKAAHGARGALLRRELKVPPTSPLADRSLRHDFIHIDERIEEWRRVDGRIHIDANVGPGPISQFISGLATTPRSEFRYYDRAKGTVSFWGVEYDINAIVGAVRALLPEVQRQV